MSAQIFAQDFHFNTKNIKKQSKSKTINFRRLIVLESFEVIEIKWSITRFGLRSASIGLEAYFYTKKVSYFKIGSPITVQ